LRRLKFSFGKFPAEKVEYLGEARSSMDKEMFIWNKVY